MPVKRLLVVALGFGALGLDLVRADTPPLRCGRLQIVGIGGKPVDVADKGPIAACPLKHTDVSGDIVGFVGRVTVKQVFHNPLDEKIEAVYTFPLPQDAAVDDMVMTVGDRRIIGQIKPRAEAREVYEAAKAAGHVASLLDQERPNIFSQSVANIEPGVEVTIEISYVQTLKYDEGVFEWVFPMVVGPRYIPGQATSTVPPVAPEHQGKVGELDRNMVKEGGQKPKGKGWSPDTDQVGDASRITPPVAKPGYRAGHDISLSVRIDAGTPIHDVTCVSHDITTEVPTPDRMVVGLKNQAEIPNKDFILRYRLATDEIGDAFLVHSDERGHYFTLVLQPPRRVIPAQLVNREIIFVLDTSGSMRGFPIDKAKAAMAKIIDTMQPDDAFNVITFAGNTRILWTQPRANTPDNRAEARTFLASRRGGGGTEMMKAINAALGGQHDPSRLRIVCFMTDGYVGNDLAIIDAVDRYAGTTRVFSFGIGNSVNRFLMDGMAHAGRGEVEYVTLAEKADASVERFHERILAPVLTDIEIDWGDLPVDEVFPKRIPDLFASKPVMIHGRLTDLKNASITLRGNVGDGPFERQLAIEDLGGAPGDGGGEHPALASLWARSKIDHLMAKNLGDLQRGQFPDELEQAITQIGVEYRLMTQFTSFVAVEEMTVTVGGEPRTIAVPVDMPDGVSYEGVFGDGRDGFTAGKKMAQMRLFSRGARGRVRRASKAAPGTARPSAPRREAKLKEALADAEDEREGRARPADPKTKLAAALRELAKKVEKDGKDGNLTVGKLKVIGHKVDVMVFLRDTSAETLAALKKLGFVQTGASKATSLLIGTIDVRRLEDLAGLDAVIRVAPVSG